MLSNLLVKLSTNTYYTNYKNITLSLLFVKKHINMKFTQLSDLIAIDLNMNQYKFILIYVLKSIFFNKHITIKTFLSETQQVDSCTNIFKNSNWLEREVWDMFGIYFKNHPDLRRLLNDYTFEGFPLLKTYPISGFYELRYSEQLKMIVFEPLTLAQQNRFPK